MTRTHTCPNCGEEVVCNQPRHGKRGTGYHAAKEMTRLSPLNKEVLRVIDENLSIDWESGLTLSDVTFKVNSLRSSYGKTNVKDQTISARLSELQGLDILSCVPAEVILADRATMQFVPANQPRWHRVSKSLLEETA